MNERNTSLQKYISHFILERSPQFVVVWEIDGEKYIPRVDIFPEPGGANVFISLQAVSSETSETPLMGCLSLARLSILLDWLSKSNRVVLISRGLFPVAYLLDRHAPTHCHPPVY